MKRSLLDLISTKLNFHLSKLSKRESECLCYILRGMTIKQMADTMDLSPRTVEGYVLNIKNKLACKNRYEIIGTVLGNDFPWEDIFLLPSTD